MYDCQSWFFLSVIFPYDYASLELALGLIKITCYVCLHECDRDIGCEPF